MRITAPLSPETAVYALDFADVFKFVMLPAAPCGPLALIDQSVYVPLPLVELIDITSEVPL